MVVCTLGDLLLDVVVKLAKPLADGDDTRADTHVGGGGQAANVAALKDYTDAETATAYSISQQLVTTAWNNIFAIILMTIFFGWAGGKELVGTSYTGAKEKSAEMRADRKRKKKRKK
jgi:hypothetical protein